MFYAYVILTFKYTLVILTSIAEYLRIVSFKTPLDLQVKITYSTCKISWIAK